jgi:aspartyl-tRNA(Asn)/glutamyl-tRNA(Gln) amidotransferase subunit B
LPGCSTCLPEDQINAAAARKVLGLLFDSDSTPEMLVDAHGYRQVSDPAALDALIDQVLEAQPTAVAEFQSGQTKALGFLIGQVMQASGGKANPNLNQWPRAYKDETLEGREGRAS